MNKLETLKADFDLYLNDIMKSSFKEKSILNSAITYSLSAPSKKIRPLLVLAFSETFKGNKKVAHASGAAVEMIHTYSLIHDDLPAMDNDDFRRGLPTNHKVYGEAQAILAGDSLLNYAPQFLISELSQIGYPPELNLELVSKLLQASGHEGMIRGQSLDIEFESKELNFSNTNDLQQLLKDIHKLKTGSIITWSAIAGLYSCGDRNLIDKYSCKVTSIGQRIGLLFQVVDDIIDVTSSFEEIGKTPGKDIASGKLTYPALYGLEGAIAMAQGVFTDILLDLDEMKASNLDTSLVLEILEQIFSKFKS